MSHTHSDPCQNIESVTGRRGKKLNPVKTIKKNKKEIVVTQNHKKMTEPTSQMAESKIFVLPYRWQDGKYCG